MPERRRNSILLDPPPKKKVTERESTTQKNHLLVQNLGSSLPSPQSSLLSQYDAAFMHLPFPHENSLIEHFWLTPAEDFDCFAPCTSRLITTTHMTSATILIFIAFIFDVTFFSSLSPRFRLFRSLSVLRLNLYCF